MYIYIYTNEKLTEFGGCSGRNDEIFRMPRTLMRFFSKQNLQDARHGKAILNEQSTKFSECPARDRDFLQNFQNLCTGARFFSEYSGCSARERDFLQNLNEEDELERSSPV